jgi:hypothetical protein
MSVLVKAYSTAPDNLFVMLTLLDTLIGCIRESSGRFICGSLHLHSIEESIRYLQDKCM